MKCQSCNFDAYTFSKRLDFNEAAVRHEFAQAVPLRTVVVYCYDPRAVGIPAAVARELGEVYPGEILADANGNRVASTTTLFEVVVAGGRAVDALRSIAVAQHLFGIENIAVVHHTHCGATTFTPDGIIDAFRREQNSDISRLSARANLAISDYVASLKNDTQLIRSSPGTPRHVNIYGFMYDIDTHHLTRVVEDSGQTLTQAERDTPLFAGNCLCASQGAEAADSPPPLNAARANSSSA